MIWTAEVHLQKKCYGKILVIKLPSAVLNIFLHNWYVIINTLSTYSNFVLMSIKKTG